MSRGCLLKHSPRMSREQNGSPAHTRLTSGGPDGAGPVREPQWGSAGKDRGLGSIRSAPVLDANKVRERPRLLTVRVLGCTGAPVCVLCCGHILWGVAVAVTCCCVSLGHWAALGVGEVLSHGPSSEHRRV